MLAAPPGAWHAADVLGRADVGGTAAEHQRIVAARFQIDIEHFQLLRRQQLRGAGDAIFFDWDNSGNADHVGIVIGTDGTNVSPGKGRRGEHGSGQAHSQNDRDKTGNDLIPHGP